MMREQLRVIQFDDWVVKVREPEVLEGAPVVLMLHGWTGDENSMWVFSQQIDPKALLIAPRGLFPSKHSFRDGYSWMEDVSTKWAGKSAFSHSADQTEALLENLSARYPANFQKLNLVGFSQGAALSSVLVLNHPERVSRLAMLSGFLPEEISPGEADLEGVDVFIGHGSLDEIVPEDKAHTAYLFFQASGANVRYCLTEVGHKLGADCFQAFNHFLKDLS